MNYPFGRINEFFASDLFHKCLINSSLKLVWYPVSHQKLKVYLFFIIFPGAGENYENTMTAFKRAIALGTEMLELDVHLTKDELVVVSHDHNLLRSTGYDKDISELNYADMPLLKEQLNLDFDPGIHLIKICVLAKWSAWLKTNPFVISDFTFAGSGLQEERKFPLLDDVFKHFPTIPINIDVKVDNDKLIKEVSRLIKTHNREDYTVWGNFDDKITMKCYKEVCTFISQNISFSMLVLEFSFSEH